jgi:O-antigen ligase
MRLPEGRLTWIIVAVLLAGGLAGFYWKYQNYFAKGATSVVARFDYWRAATDTAAANPLLGTGPGTFAKSYAAVKRPESEMARLAHNDYLQQACDSGVPGALAYAGTVVGVLWVSGGWLRRRRDLFAYAVWLGVLGWALQGTMEFGLYLPGLGWTAVALLGWLLGRNEIDTKPGNG